MTFRHLFFAVIFGGGLMLARGRAAEGEFATELAAAKALLDAGKYAESRTAYESVLSRAPENPEANAAVTLFACDNGEWEKALRCAAKALASDPANARYQYGWGSANGIAALKGGIFSKFGYAKKCLAAYERAVELEPRTPRYRWVLLNYYQQAPGIVGGDLAKAYAQAAELKKIDPAEGRQAYAQLYLGEKKYDQAFHLYDEALQSSPNDYSTLYQFGRLTLMTSQRLDEGFIAFQRCLDQPPIAGKETPSRANIYWRLGVVWERKNHPVEARAEYLTALKEDPNFRPAQQALEKLDGRTR